MELLTTPDDRVVPWRRNANFDWGFCGGCDGAPVAWDEGVLEVPGHGVQDEGHPLPEEDVLRLPDDLLK